ncbi:MAG: SDR family NAD(P)-dependent oxidoreductase [Trueperaceae bacterium]
MSESTSIRTILVTGGSHGLGSFLVEHFARAGDRVVFTFASSEDKALALQERLSREGLKVVASKADATNFRQAHQLVDDVVERWGTLDILINNVGGAGRAEGYIWEISEEVWDEVIGLNLKSCFNYTHAVAPVFIEQHAGTIVNIGSINGLRGKERQPAYTSAKAGMLGFTKSMAKELGPFGINVNMVASGYIGTEKQRLKVSENHKLRILEATALKHLVEPAEVARVVSFLASADAEHITGAVLRLDAGEYI